MKSPTIEEIYRLCLAVKADIQDDYRATDDPDDDAPGIQLTVGADTEGGWSYQTGDNSYTGGAYHYPYWGVGYLYRGSNCRDVARDIVNEIAEQMADQPAP